MTCQLILAKLGFKDRSNYKDLLFAAVCRDESKYPATCVYDNAHGHVSLEVLESVQRCGVIHVA